MTPKQSRVHRSNQLSEDVAASGAVSSDDRQPDDSRRASGALHRTTPAERRYRDRGAVNGTPRWHDLNRRDAD